MCSRKQNSFLADQVHYEVTTDAKYLSIDFRVKGSEVRFFLASPLLRNRRRKEGKCLVYDKLCFGLYYILLCQLFQRCTNYCMFAISIKVVPHCCCCCCGTMKSCPFFNFQFLTPIVIASSHGPGCHKHFSPYANAGMLNLFRRCCKTCARTLLILTKPIASSSVVESTAFFHRSTYFNANVCVCVNMCTLTIPSKYQIKLLCMCVPGVYIYR